MYRYKDGSMVYLMTMPRLQITWWLKCCRLEFQDFRSDVENKDGAEVPVEKFEKKM